MERSKSKVLVVGDIHGRHEYLMNAIERGYNLGYDQIIFIGDICDSHNRSNEDILLCYKLLFKYKSKDPNKIIILLGNHDVAYLNPFWRCDGFRAELFPTLKYYLIEMKNMFQYAHQIGKYLFTHAGISRAWFDVFKPDLEHSAERFGLSLDNSADLAEIINIMSKTALVDGLHTIGHRRGGAANIPGGPLWCDRLSEMLQYGPISGYHQVVGHSPVSEIYTVDEFRGKKWNNTSVTFVDVFGDKEEYLTLEI